MPRTKKIKEEPEIEAEEIELEGAPLSEDKLNAIEEMHEMIESGSDEIVKFGTMYFKFSDKTDSIAAIELAKTIVEFMTETSKETHELLAAHKKTFQEDSLRFAKVTGSLDQIEAYLESNARIYGYLQKRQRELLNVKMH